MCGFRWCGRQLCLRNMPISGVNATPRPTAVYASDPALPRRPQDSLPSCLLGFERTRLSLASSFQLPLAPRTGLLPKVERDRRSGLCSPCSSSPQAGDVTCLARRGVRGMRCHLPSLRPGPFPPRPPPPLIAGLFERFIGTTSPSDSSPVPRRLRLLAFPSRPGIVVATAGQGEASQVPSRSLLT